MIKDIHVLTLQDYGMTKGEATRIFQVLTRYITPHHVQVVRPVILKNKLTDTTMTLRAFKLSDIDKIVQYRLINLGRSKLSNWIDLARLVEAFKKCQD